MIAPQRLGPRLRRVDQVLDHRRRDVVAVQRRIQRRPITSGLRKEQVALQDAVVERCVGVDAGLEQPVEFLEGSPAIALQSIRRQDRPVLSVRQSDLSGRERDDRVLHVGGRQRGIGVVRRRRKPAGQREQMFAFFVEHVLLLPVEILDGKAVDRELGVGVQPLLDGRQGDLQELGVEPRARLVRLGEQNLHLLTAGVDLVVALILVVLERGEVPDLIRELADVVGQLHRRQQSVGAFGQRALQSGVGANLPLEVVVGPLPLGPGREDVREVPFESVGNVVTLAKLQTGRCLGGREQIHAGIIADRQLIAYASCRAGRVSCSPRSQEA
jgi:hypothetical protein